MIIWLSGFGYSRLFDDFYRHSGRADGQTRLNAPQSGFGGVCDVGASAFADLKRWISAKFPCQLCDNLCRFLGSWDTAKESPA